MDEKYEAGEEIIVDGREAEVISFQEIGDVPYVRVVLDGDTKNICTEDVSIERKERSYQHLENLDEHEIQPTNETLSADQFDMRTDAIKLQLGYEQDKLLSISTSLVRLEYYQLACVNEVMDGIRQRYLIADDVGLGKTIEAGLIFKELLARGRADRVLFIVPAHLQKKWERDMDRFFDIDLTLADRTWVEAERRKKGEKANIWAEGDKKLLTSMAFLRQDEFQEDLNEAFWDLVIVDEVHKASKKRDTPSKTARTVETVSHQSDSLLLLSATPHNGKEQSLKSLINYIDPFLVAPDESLSNDVVDDVMIRRGKETVYDEDGKRVFPEREVKTVPVNMSSAEKEFYDKVTAYVQEVYNRSEKLNEPAVGFAMALMQKRLVSSIGAIRETLKRRLKDLSDIGEARISSEAEAYIEGEDLEEEDKEYAERELERLTTSDDKELEEELKTLRTLVKKAEELPIDSKATQVKRFINDLLEREEREKLLIFTEYRDTLDYLLDEVFDDEEWCEDILVIHGGVDREKRQEVEDEFNYGQSRILLATDAASEGIDLQHSCHIMLNYELPWNPNKLEQRIGRLHRYGQDKTVKVWNFQFDNTRESEIFDLLQDKIENIRAHIGNTSDMIGILEELDLEDLIMKSVRNEEPPEATKEELEEMIDERQRTLKEWYERTPLDCSTFDSKSRKKIKKIVEDSEEVYGTEADIKSFFIDTVSFLGGQVTKKDDKIFEIDPPEELRGYVSRFEKITFDREVAMDRGNLNFISPDSEVMQVLIGELIEKDSFGEIGMKILSFLDNPGITFNFTLKLEDGTNTIIREELLPVFVDLESKDAQKNLGKRVNESKSEQDIADKEKFLRLLMEKEELQERAQKYASRHLQRLKKKEKEERREETQEQLNRLEAYREAEKRRIKNFIEKYKRKEESEDMRVAIRKQRSRLENLEERIEERKEEIRKKAKVVSLAPSLKNWCLCVSE